MKRFTVISGIFVLCAGLFSSSANATAPTLRDLPDVKLIANGGSVGNLVGMATGAYDILDFVKDVDTASTGLTESISGIINVNPPTGVSGDPSGSTILIEPASSTVNGGSEAIVDIYGRVAPGWVRYTVSVADASGPVSDNAIVKYSTFELNQPTINSGLASVGDLSLTSREFAWVVGGGTATSRTIYRLDTAITPADASQGVTWRLYVNSITTDSTPDNYDANGNWIGISHEHEADGAALANGGINFSINGNGQLTLTSSGAVSQGPWLVGILATETGNPDNTDGTRILVSSALLASVTFDTPTYNRSTTFDDIPAGTVLAEATDTRIQTATGSTPAYGRSGFTDNSSPKYNQTQIYAGSHWRYEMAAPADNILNSVPLTIVDLETDSLLDAGSKPSALGGASNIAGGNGIRAALAAPGVAQSTIGPRPVLGKNQVQGFRLQSFAFQGVGIGEVVTFSASVATDAADATNLPEYQMFVSSGFGGTISGLDVRVGQVITDVAENNNFGAAVALPSATRPRVNLPTKTEGWSRISINYSPGYTKAWNDANGDTVINAADDTILDSVTTFLNAGWSGSQEHTVFYAGVVFRAQTGQTSTVRVWLDNLQVYRSAYELDLALGSQELTQAVTVVANDELHHLTEFGGLKLNAIGQSGNVDGSIESYAVIGDATANFSAIGFNTGRAGGNAPIFDLTPKLVFGGTPGSKGKHFIDGDQSNVTIAAQDHTRNGGSNKSLCITLTGVDGVDGTNNTTSEWGAVRMGLNGSILAGSGSGTYCLECYVAKDHANNVSATDRQAQFRALIQEVAPNWLSTAQGVLYVFGGLPDSVGDNPPYNWARIVATMYIPDCEMLRGFAFAQDTFQDEVTNFDCPIYVDDWKVFRVDDPAEFFDADLYDAS